MTVVRQIALLALLGLLAGSVVGVLAVGFVEAVLWLNDVLHVTTESRGGSTRSSWVVAAAIGIPTLGGVVVGLLALAMPDRRFLAVPDAIREAQSPDGNMPVKGSLVSAAAACLSLGAGASVGQYGPLVHLGATVGSWLRRAVVPERAFGTIGMACGAAAAISAAFHAPIAGLVFAREVLLRHYSLRAFAPIAVASTVAYVVDHVIFGRAPLFQIDRQIVASPYEYLVFIAIGILGALVATAYMRSIDLAGRLAARLRWPLPLKTASAGLALGIVALQVPEILGIGQDVLRHALTGDVYSAADLGLIFVAKLLLTALCLGFGFAGGVFSPALLIGTLFGALVGTGASAVFGDQVSPVAVYAVCGLVAVTSPVIGAPLTTVLIVFELTQSFDLATAALISVAFANLVGYRIYGRSLFDVQLLARGFDLGLGRDKVMVQRHTIRDLLDQDYTRLEQDATLSEAGDALARDARSEAYIVDAEGRYVGTLTVQRLLKLIAEGESLDRPAGDFAGAPDVELHPDTSVWNAMTAIRDVTGDSVPVLDEGKLVGALQRAKIVSAYLEIVQRVRSEEHAAV